MFRHLVRAVVELRGPALTQEQHILLVLGLVAALLTHDRDPRDASSYVNGQAIVVDGGLLTGPLRLPAMHGLLEMLWQTARPAPQS